MTSTVPEWFEPIVIHRSSPYGKRRSGAVNETRSKTSVASVKVTPCFSLLISSLTRSHSNPTRNTIHYVYTLEKVFVSMSNRRILTPHEARSAADSWDRCIENTREKLCSRYMRWRSGAHVGALRGTSCPPSRITGQLGPELARVMFVWLPARQETVPPGATPPSLHRGARRSGMTALRIYGSRRALIFRRLRMRPFRRARVHTGRKSNDNFGASSGPSGDGPSGGKRRHLCVVGHGGQE